MQRLVQLESKTVVSGGNVQVSLRDLPAGYVIRQLILSAEMVITLAAGAAAVSEFYLPGLFTNIELGKRVRGTGRFFNFLYWMTHGREVEQLAGLPAAGAGAYRRNIRTVIPFADPWALKPIDTCPRTEWFKDTPLVIDFALQTAWDANHTFTSGTLRTYALIEEVDDGFLPSAVQMGYTDWSGQQPVLESGLYSHVFAFKDTNTVGAGNDVTTNAEVTSVSATADSTPLISLANIPDLAFRWNLNKADGANRRALSATAPVGGEMLASTPAYTAGAAATVSLELLPLVCPSFGYKLTDLPEAKSALGLTFQGTLTTFRIGWRRLERRSGEQALRGFAKAGNPQAAENVTAKTDSKVPLSARAGRWLAYLPLRGEKKNG